MYLSLSATSFWSIKPNVLAPIWVVNSNKTIHNNVKNGYSKEVLEAIEKALPDLVNKRARQLSVEETKIIGEKLADLDIL